MKIPNYPNDFYDFSNGFDIDNNTINEWINESIKKLEQNKNMPYSAIRSGNTLVLVEREDDLDSYEVHVIKKYGTARTKK